MKKLVRKTTGKAAAKKAVAKKTVRRAKELPTYDPVKEKLTKSELARWISEGTEVELRDVKKVLADLEQIMLGSLVRKGLGEFTLPGLLKIVTKHIPAKKGGKKAISPFTGEEYITKAKPATVRVKVRALAKLKNSALV